MTEYYKILGITSDATLREVKIAYRKLSKKFHPDVNQGDQYFEERFKEIQEAYEKIASEKIKENKNYEYSVYAKRETEKKAEYSNHSKKQDSQTKSSVTTKNYYKQIFIAIFILILIAIFKPMLQKSIKENAKNDLLNTYDNNNSSEHTFKSSNKNLKSTDSNLAPDSISFLQSINHHTKADDQVLEAENKSTLNESTQWILLKLNRYVKEYIYNSEPSMLSFPTKSRYYNYYFTISDNNLIVTYSVEFSEIVVDEKTKNMYRDSNYSDDTIKRLAGKMTVTESTNFKIVIPMKKIENMYFDEHKNYKGNCDFSLSTTKNEMINYNLSNNNKSYSSNFSFEFDCSQEENLGKRLNDAFFHIKKIIPQTNSYSNEPF